MYLAAIGYEVRRDVHGEDLARTIPSDTPKSMSINVLVADVLSGLVYAEAS